MSSESLRDQLAANYDKITTQEVTTPVETPATPSGDTTPTPSKITAAPTAEERARDEKGRFAEKDKAEKADKKTAAPVTPGTPPPPDAGVPQVAAAPTTPSPIPRPSSWEKAMWPIWDKLNSGTPLSAEEARKLAEYNVKRETQFQHGVATYNDAWNKNKPIIEAIQPFMPILEKHGIQPGTWIQNLGMAHKELAMGTPEQKLQRFQWLAQQYGVPIQALTDPTAQQEFLSKGAQGQNFQLPPNVLTREEAERLWAEKFNAVRSQEDIQRFAQDEKYPHFEAVRETMAQLLDAELADDLPSAYEAALRHPRHSDLWQAIQEQERTRQAEANAKAEAERLQKAKGKAVSVKSATPTTPGGEKPTDRRSQIEANYEARMGGGRV